MSRGWMHCVLTVALPWPGSLNRTVFHIPSFIHLAFHAPLPKNTETWDLLPSTWSSASSISHPCSLSQICYADVVRIASLRIYPSQLVRVSSAHSHFTPKSIKENLRSWSLFYTAFDTAQTQVWGRENERNPIHECWNCLIWKTKRVNSQMSNPPCFDFWLQPLLLIILWCCLN